MVSPDSFCGIKKCVKWMLQLSKEQVPVWNGDLERTIIMEKISITVIEDWRIRNLITFMSKPI